MDSAPLHPVRQGPRPLPLHLLLAGLGLQVGLSSSQLPTSNLALPGAGPQLQARAAALAPALAALDPAALAAALGAEAASRAHRFLDGVQAYRAHPYRRSLVDPPVIWQEGTTRLLDYGATHPAARDGTPILCVPSLVNRGYILDLMPGQSLLRWLAEQGFRPFLVDWGAPGPAERRFTLTDYVCGRLEAALEAVTATTQRKPLLLGYCMGGLLALALAVRAQASLAGLILMATPWDFHAGDKSGSARAQAEALARGLPLHAPALDVLGELPLDALQSLFAAVDPMTGLRKFQAFARLDPAGAKAQAFVALEDWLNDGVPLAAPVAREALGLWYGQNTPLAGEWRIAGRAVDPGQLRLPSLVLVPEADRIVPPASARALASAIPDAELRVPSVGHIGMVVSGSAKREVWEPIADWCRVQA